MKESWPKKENKTRGDLNIKNEERDNFLDKTIPTTTRYSSEFDQQGERIIEEQTFINQNDPEKVFLREGDIVDSSTEENDDEEDEGEDINETIDDAEDYEEFLFNGQNREQKENDEKNEQEKIKSELDKQEIRLLNSDGVAHVGPDNSGEVIGGDEEIFSSKERERIEPPLSGFMATSRREAELSYENQIYDSVTEKIKFEPHLTIGGGHENIKTLKKKKKKLPGPEGEVIYSAQERQEKGISPLIKGDSSKYFETKEYNNDSIIPDPEEEKRIQEERNLALAREYELEAKKVKREKELKKREDPNISSEFKIEPEVKKALLNNEQIKPESHENKLLTLRKKKKLKLNKTETNQNLSERKRILVKKKPKKVVLKREFQG